MAKRWREAIWRGAWAMIGSTAASCLYCAAVDPETTPLGLLTCLFVAPSVILFVLIERIRVNRLPRYLGFFIPVVGMAGWLGFSLWSALAQAARNGLSDGGELVIAYFMEAYGVGVFVAFVFLLFHWGDWARRNDSRSVCSVASDADDTVDRT